MAALSAGELRPKSAQRTVSLVRAALRGKAGSLETAERDKPLIERLQRLRASGLSRWCVLYLKNGQELQSPWFYSLPHCQLALEILTHKHGYRAVIFRD